MLARWSSWGAIPDVFDETRRHEWANAREELHQLLSDKEWRSASRATLNAHFTDAAFVQAMWSAAARLGFDGGSVLEPGCGSGNFLAFAPRTAHLIGVEWDAVTAAIAERLYPSAVVLNESFAETRISKDSLDLVVGNVPFADVVLNDPDGNPGRHSIHNHFLIKSVSGLRPGGMALLLTSRYTLDSAGEAARLELAGMADMVGVVRLPNRAHARGAGTDVITDLVVLRRREPDAELLGLPWLHAPRTLLPDEHDPALEEEVAVNEAFLSGDPRAVVIGDLRSGHGAYQRADLVVPRPPEVEVRLEAALERITNHALADRAGWTPRRSSDGPALVRPVPESERPVEGLVCPRAAGFTRIEDGVEVEFAVPRTQRDEIRQLLTMRDRLIELLDLESRPQVEDQVLDKKRAALNATYDAYLARFGPINRFTSGRTGRQGDDGEEILREQWRSGADPPRRLRLGARGARGLRSARRWRRRPPSSIDVSWHRGPIPTRAESAADALAITVDEMAEVDLRRIARLLALPGEEEARASGRVGLPRPRHRQAGAGARISLRKRPAEAQGLAREGRSERTGPLAHQCGGAGARAAADLGPHEIDARLGATWIPVPVVQRFVAELLNLTHLGRCGRRHHGIGMVRRGAGLERARNHGVGYRARSNQPPGTRPARRRAAMVRVPQRDGGRSTSRRRWPRSEAAEDPGAVPSSGSGRTPDRTRDLVAEYETAVSTPPSCARTTGRRSPLRASPRTSSRERIRSPPSPGWSPSRRFSWRMRSAPERRLRWSWVRSNCAASARSASPVSWSQPHGGAVLA